MPASHNSDADDDPSFTPVSTSTRSKRKSTTGGGPKVKAKGSNTGAFTNMETYNGLVRTPTDAIILFEACRLGLLPRVQRRLSEKERQSIRSGSVFVWDEREAGMRRWTDGKSWSASRVSGSFLTYREMEGKRGSNTVVSPGQRTTQTPENAAPEDAEDGTEGPDGYRYKPDGLMKQSFSITTSQGQHLHLISYYSRSSPTANHLRQPSQDPSLASIQPASGMYPESTVNDQASVPAVTRSPMPGAPNYIMAPQPYTRPPPHHHAYLPPGYIPHPAYMAFPLSPMSAPQGYIPYQPGMQHIGYHPAYAQPGLHMNQAPPSSYDQRPLRAGEARQSLGGMPPAPYTQSLPPPPVTQSYPQSTYATAPAPMAHEQQREGNGASLDPRLDPRLSSAIQQNAPPLQRVLSQAEEPYPQPTAQSQLQHLPSTSSEGRPMDNVTAAGTSQPPKMNVLVSSLPAPNGGAAPADQKQGQQSQPQPQPNGVGEKNEQARDGSTSPGGTKRTAPPQDIPSEKLGFREDKRVLSMLDRSFARIN